MMPGSIERQARRAAEGPDWVGRNARRLHREAEHVRRLASGVPGLEQILANISHRLATRTDTFLDTVERAVFAHPASPYRPLLEASGHDFASVKTLVGRLGVEGTLRRLAGDGVFVRIDEFKGTRAARRGDRVFRFSPRDFDNPLVRTGLGAASGGTRSDRISTVISVEDHRMGVEHLAAALNAYGVLGRPAGVWLGDGHGASLWAVAALAALRTSAVRWFTLLRDPHGYYNLLTAVCRLYGVALPRLTYAPFTATATILDWTRNFGDTACTILTFPSLALRLALAAKSSGAALRNVTFITIGEPLTRAKVPAIEAVGARAFSSLGFTEFGRATYGCANPVASDDTHICRDSIAVIQQRRVVDHLGTEVDALYFTSLQPYARKILLNMETGDCATFHERRCGCALEALGWIDRLQDIRSFEKLNAVGRLFFGSALHSLIEETLPARFGGQATDYQLLEEEDNEGFTRLTLLVHPRLDAIDEQAALECLKHVLRGLSPAQSTIWHEAGVVRLRRGVPMLTPVGKLMPLHHLGVGRT